MRIIRYKDFFPKGTTAIKYKFMNVHKVSSSYTNITELYNELNEFYKINSDIRVINVETLSHTIDAKDLCKDYVPDGDSCVHTFDVQVPITMNYLRLTYEETDLFYKE